MTMQLLITFIDYTNERSTITLTINKNELISNSKYFESLFSKNFDEHDKNIVQIDLTSNENCYDGKIIEHFFMIFCLEHELTKQSQTILNTFSDKCLDPIITSSTIKVNFCFDMDLSEITEMLQLCDYFICDAFKQYLIKCVIIFPTFFETLLKCKETHYTFNESYVLEYFSINQIDNKKLKDEIFLYKQHFMLEQFMKNIVTFFTFYKMIDRINIFKDTITVVDKIFGKFLKFTYFKDIEQIEKLNITDEELKQIPLDTLFQLLNYAPKIISIDKTVFKLYDFYDILNYEPSNFVTFEYICNKDCKDNFCANNCTRYYEDDMEELIKDISDDDDDDECEADEEELIKDVSDSDDDEYEVNYINDKEIFEGNESILFKNKEYFNMNKRIAMSCTKPYANIDYDGKIQHIMYKGCLYKPKANKSPVKSQPKKDKILPKIPMPHCTAQHKDTIIPYYTKSIIPYEIFINVFHTKTNNIFADFDWNNVVLAGGFLYGIVDNICNSILPGSDIDLFVFGEPEIIENKTKQLLGYFLKFDPYYVVNGKVTTIIIPKLNYDIQIVSFENHLTALSVITQFDYNYVKLYFDGNNIFCTLDNLLAFKYKIAMLNYNIEQKEYMTTIRIYKTITKGLKIKYDEQIKNSCINRNCIKMNELHDNDQIKSSLIKSVSIRKLIPHLEHNEVIQLIKSYYKTQNVFTNIDQIKIKTVENSEYDFLKVQNKNVNIDNINAIDVIKKFGDITYYSFRTLNSDKYNNISIQTNYCTFTTRINGNHQNISLVLNITDDDTKHKLISLHNCVYKIINYKIINNEFKRNSIDRMHICGLNFKKIEKKIGENLKLVIHINKNMKNYDKITEQLKNSNINSVVKILCSGTFWFAKSTRSCGIKFYADTICVNKSYNIL